MANRFWVDRRRSTLHFHGGDKVKLAPWLFRIVCILAAAKDETPCLELFEAAFEGRGSKNPETLIHVAVHRINVAVKAVAGRALIGCRVRAGYFICREWNQGSYWLNEERWALSGVMHGAYRDLLR